MGALSRNKGVLFERWVVKALQQVLPNARRGIQYRDGGKEASDVIGTPFHLECKHGKQPSPRAALAQAKADAENGKLIACVIKDDRRDPFVVMPFSDWIELVSDAARDWK